MVSSAYKLVRLNLDRLLAQFEDDEDRVIGPDDKDTMTALRALQQVATGLVAAHPGLDAVTGAGDETDTVNEDDLERVRALLDAKGE